MRYLSCQLSWRQLWHLIANTSQTATAPAHTAELLSLLCSLQGLHTSKVWWQVVGYSGPHTFTTGVEPLSSVSRSLQRVQFIFKTCQVLVKRFVMWPMDIVSQLCETLSDLGLGLYSTLTSCSMVCMVSSSG